MCKNTDRPIKLRLILRLNSFFCTFSRYNIIRRKFCQANVYNLNKKLNLGPSAPNVAKKSREN